MELAPRHDDLFNSKKKKKLEKQSFCATFSCKAYVGFINGAYCIQQVSITVIIKQLCYTGNVKKHSILPRITSHMLAITSWFLFSSNCFGAFPLRPSHHCSFF